MEDIKFKSCSNPDCPKPNPQLVSKFSKEPSHTKDGYSYLCIYCKNVKAKLRRNFKKSLKILNLEDQNIVIACLYVNSLESISRLSKLFDVTEDQIIKILKQENLYEYIVCKSCGKLKHISEFSKNHNLRSSKGIQTDCKICVAKRHREDGLEYARYDIYSKKLNLYEEIRDNNNILEVKCTYCGEFFKPLRKMVDLRVNTIMGYEQKRNSESRLYCSDTCKKSCPVYGKLPKTLIREDAIRAGLFIPQDLNREVQPELRQMVFARDNYTCVKCNTHKNQLCKGLHCHHVEGIRWNPLESADADQCITVCDTCHIKIHKQPDCGYHDMRCDKT